MEQIIDAFAKLKEINDYYTIDNSEVNWGLENINDEKVCMPVIGKFSSGKSALCNRLLEYTNVLKEDITPETAVPAEILYGETERIIVYFKNEENSNCKEISISEYINNEFLSNEISKIRLYLRNNFLKKIKDVMIVDMPGFESGIELHNIAINDYIDNSQAYFVVFPADDMVLKNSLGNTLKEIYSYEKPIYIIITKCDKEPTEIIDANIVNLKEKIKKFIGEKDCKIARTGRKEEYDEEYDDIDTVRNFLYEIQDKSTQIIANKYIKIFKSISDVTLKFLNELIKNSELSESELVEKEERLNNDIKKLGENVLKINESFNLSIEKCINDIKGDVNTALHSNESSLVSMALNGSDISDKINSVVRSAVTNGVQRRFVPLVEKYIDKISGTANIDVNISAAGIAGAEIADSGKGGAIAAGVLAGLILGPIGGIIVGFLVNLFSKNAADKKREEEKARIRRELNGNIFPNIMNQVGGKLEIEIKKKVAEINDSVGKSIETNENAMRKALEDIKEKRAKETEENNNKIDNAKNNIMEIENLRNILYQENSDTSLY